MYFHKMNTQRMSFYEQIISYLFSKIIKYKHSLAGTFTTAFLTYVFAFVHKLPNWDDIHFDNIRGTLGLDHGRWMLDVINFIMPHYSMPWIYGMLSIAILAVANCYVMKIFDIKNKYLQVLLSGLLISFQAVVGTLSYMFLSYMYAISLLLSVISVYVFLKGEWKNRLYAVILMVISMGFYQAYWAISVVFFIVISLRDLLEDRKEVKRIIIDGVYYLSFVCISAILYYAINSLIFSVFDIHFNEYSSDRVNNDWPLTERIYWTIVNMISCIFYGTYGFVVTWLSKAIHWFYILFVSLGLLIPVAKKHKYCKVVIGFILLCLFPIGMNCLNIIAPTGTHSLTLITFASLYILVVIISQFYSYKKWLYDVVLFSLTLLLFNNILIANKSYLKQYLQYEEAKSFYTGVMVNVEQTPGFNENCKLALIGDAYNLINDMNDFTNDDITGISKNSIINIYSRTQFICKYIGFTIPFANESEVSIIKNNKEFVMMPHYPYYGSVKKIGDIVVVKFSEDND